MPFALMPRRLSRTALFYSALGAPLLSTGSMVARAQTVQMSGVVKDPDQSLVSHATVTLTNQQTMNSQQATTGDSGVYTFSSIIPGTYQLKVEKAGFATSTVTSFNIASGQNMTRDIALSLGGANASVTVSGNASGTSANGYYVEKMQNGVMGSTPIVNLPYTVSVISSDEIANTQAKSLRDSIRYLPLVSFQEQQGSEIIRPQTRGIQGSIAQNTRMDGMAMAITGANPMEEYEQLEVVNGLGASMYGPANPSGMFNFVLKRPTEQRTNNISLDYDNKTIGTAAGDFGGRLGPHKIFGYRSNLLIGEGNSYVSGSFLRRRLAEFAFDIRPTNRTLVDVHYSAYDIVQRGYPGWFSYGLNKPAAVNGVSPNFVLPSAPDPTRVGYGQYYAGVNLTTQSASARVLHDFSPNWHAMAGGLWQNLNRYIASPVNTLTSNAGAYNTSLASGFAPRFNVDSDLGYITGNVRKWGMSNDIVIGSEGYNFIQYASGSLPSAQSLVLGKASVAAPVIYPFPTAGLYLNSNLYQSSIVHQQGFNLGDMITLPKHFIVRLAASQDWIGVDNNNAKQIFTSGSNKNGISPSVSILYKPEDAMTFYGTYASSLQQGDIAPGGAANANVALAPYRSKEWELGFKDQLRQMNLGAALFRIQRPFANTDAVTNVFEITGQQVNYGAEISAEGHVTRSLLVNGGFTALNARLNDTGIASTDGKRFVGAPDYKSNVLSEYKFSRFEDLVITGDWQFVGRRAQDDQNLNYTAGYSTFDFGLRYAHEILGKSSTWRFSANNVTNEHYYSTIGPGDITGTNLSANTAFLGVPRTFAASVQFGF